MAIFDKLFGDRDKIKVQFIDVFNGKTIGVAEMKADQLPETFSISTTMHLQNADWEVEEAIPENSVDFMRTKSLILKMRKIETVNVDDLWFSLPTISNENPQTSASVNETEFDISIHEDDYRQDEFLNKTSIPLIEQEFDEIKNVLENFSKKSDKYMLFKNCYARKIIGEPSLMICFSELLNLFKISDFGTVKINNETLVDSFAFKTKNTTFYGTKNDDIVTQLCISEWNENTINEILTINSRYNLVFVNWCNVSIINQ